MNSIKITNVWQDEIDGDPYTMTFSIKAESEHSSGMQECDCSPDALVEIGNAMVAHSYDFSKKRVLSVNADFIDLPQVKLILHGADTSGRLPLEIVFQLNDAKIGKYTSTVVIWIELGELERFGKSLVTLPKRGIGSFSEISHAGFDR